MAVSLTTPAHLFLASSQRIHFIGIGGIGMSGIAEILLTMGYAVSGSDLKRSAVTDRLVGMGARFFEGHAAENAAASDVVVTSMIAAVLAGGGLDPTVVVGGRVNALGSNARLGGSQYLVAEADESDRSFLKLSPILAVVTNLDREHMDCYSDMEDVELAFLAFMDRVPFYGAVTACIDNPQLAAILPRARRRVFTYGTAREADYRIEHLAAENEAFSRFVVSTATGPLGPFELHVPGR